MFIHMIADIRNKIVDESVRRKLIEKQPRNRDEGELNYHHVCHVRTNILPIEI